VGKLAPPKRVILKDISLSFFQAPRSACWNGTALASPPCCSIMTGEDREFDGEAKGPLDCKAIVYFA